jgi:hypothetical protein
MPWFGLGGMETASATAGVWLTNTTATNTATTTAYYSALSQQQTTAATNFAGLTAATLYWGQQDMTPSQYMTLAQNRAVYYRARTEREVQEQAERQRIASEELERRMAARQIAKQRSRELLLSNLTKEQRGTFERNAWFVVEGGRTRQRYRIHDNSYSGNIHVLAGERVTHRLCCHCADGIPIYDHLLAQKIHLQFDEDAFLRMANRHAA